MTAITAYHLLTALAEVPDLHKSRGKRHSLGVILALNVAAVLSGAQSLTVISQWGREQEPDLLRRLGFTHLPGPCVATLHRIFRDLDVAALEAALRPGGAVGYPAGVGWPSTIRHYGAAKPSTRAPWSCW
jgi:DDE_Tnp_1-associated